MSETVPRRVVKLGGSLLDLPDLDVRLPRWIARQSPARHIILAGGGPFADAVRLLQPRLGLTDTEAHWLAMRAMSLSAQVVQTATAASGHRWPIVHAVNQTNDHDVLLLDVEQMLREADSDLLPENWSVSSDSIAAWVALRLQAAELVLLKSHLAEIAPPFVDEHFATLAHRLQRCRVVDFRSVDWTKSVHVPSLQAVEKDGTNAKD